MGVVYTQELLDRATAYVGQPIDQRRHDVGLAEISQLVADISGQPVGKCRQCQYSDHLATVRAYINQATRFLHPETVSSNTYALAPGFQNETFVHESYSEAVTADNLTDKAAEFFIKNGYEHAFLKNGKPIQPAKAASSEAEPAKPTAPMKKIDYQAQYEQVLGEKPADSLTIAQLVEAIEAKQNEQDAQRD